MKGHALIIIAVVGVLLVVATALDIFVLHVFSDEPPPAEPTALSKTPSEKGSTSSQASPLQTTSSQANPPQATPPAQSLEEDIQSITEAITKAATSGESREVTLVISEIEANAQAAMMLARAEIPEEIPLVINGVQVDFQRGNIVVTVVDTTLQVVFNIPVDIKITSQVGIAYGQPAVTITSISFFGSALLPRSVKDQITGLIMENLDSLLAQITEIDLGEGDKVEIEYKDINIQEEEATITAIVKPKL